MYCREGKIRRGRHQKVFRVSYRNTNNGKIKNTYDLRKRQYIIDTLIVFKPHTGYMLCVLNHPPHTLSPTGNVEQLHGNHNENNKKTLRQASFLNSHFQKVFPHETLILRYNFILL
jgi:hypothetical protein